MLERMWNEGNSHPLFVGMQTCAATLEIGNRQESHVTSGAGGGVGRGEG